MRAGAGVVRIMRLPPENQESGRRRGAVIACPDCVLGESRRKGAAARQRAVDGPTKLSPASTMSASQRALRNYSTAGTYGNVFLRILLLPPHSAPACCCGAPRKAESTPCRDPEQSCLTGPTDADRRAKKRGKGSTSDRWDGSMGPRLSRKGCGCLSIDFMANFVFPLRGPLGWAGSPAGRSWGDWGAKTHHTLVAC